jgi:very-short-patch-repair endonuclease/DNA polymerase III delta prime subunit
MPPNDFEILVERRLDAWKRQLIDLTRRNRLLNYRPTKSSTVEVVDEHPRHAVEHLVGGGTFSFDPTDTEAEEDESAEETTLGFNLSDGPTREPRRDLSRGQAWAPLGPGEDAPEHYTDNRLQTPHDAKRLQNNLTQLGRLADESIEEQGVNSLFLAAGMLKWFDGDTSSLAPLLLLPVTLARKSAATPWSLRIRDEEVVVNPAIEEKLRVDFGGLELPKLPDTIEALNLDELYGDIAAAVDPLGWSLTNDIALGIFRFQKFLMYRDIELHRAAFTSHEVIRGLADPGGGDRGLGDGSLPADVENADLDEAMAPWNTVQVRDADSSQQKAILAVRSGKHLVIEGPPGTGKSQTITNLIADAMAAGKSVLFVSEKLAALQVVRDRIDGVGLGDYLLELHSDRGSKREFVESLSRALDAAPLAAGDHQQDLRKLRALTTELRGYVVALHEPAGELAISAFQAIGEILDLPDHTPVIHGAVDEPLEFSRTTLDSHLSILNEASALLAALGLPAEHPLRGLGLRDALPAELRELTGAVTEAGEALERFFTAAEDYSELLGLKQPQTLGEISVWLEMEAVAVKAPGAERTLLENPAWNTLPAPAQEVLTVGPKFQAERAQLHGHLRVEVLDADVDDAVQQYANAVDKGILRFFTLRYWAVRKVLRSFLVPGYRPKGDRELIAAHRVASNARSNRARLNALAPDASSLFGSRWAGEESDFDDLRGFADWVVDFRRFVIGEMVEARGLEIAARGAIDPEVLAAHANALRETRTAALEAVARVSEAGRFSYEAALTSAPETEIGALAHRVSEIENVLDAAREFSRLMALMDELNAGPFRRIVEEALQTGVDVNKFVDIVTRSALESFLEEVVASRPPLRQFRTDSHEERVARFRNLDRRSMEHARNRAHLALQALRQEMLGGGLSGQLTLVQREARKRSRIKPIRRLLSAAADVVQRIKPCFMMSPLSVAQYLDPDSITFDLVVFDEASQIPPADAVGALIRGRQCVVVGDSRQLPPTNFFGAHVEAEDFEDDEDLEAVTDLESILDEMATVGVPRVRLKWHYRSEHPSLIRFSNEEFYSDQPLLVFPSSMRDRDTLGLQFELVDGGVYEGRGRNSIEARRVADAVIEHAKTEGAELTLGVGTFGVAQQQLILDELDRMRREHPEVEWFFSRGGEQKFFVKNLENIQGDDRDVILLSVTYGPDASGVIRRNFGPINKEGGWRRLNVLTTRAKRRLRIFSSMRGEQIHVQNISRGAMLLRRYLKYAETGEYEGTTIGPGEPESPFERAVIQALHGKGYQTVSQVGEAGYRIDIGVLDREMPGRFVCGIECDGASYHSAATVRDRDRLRQQVLEDRGWVIHRVWSTDWFQDRKSQMERLVRLIEATRKNGVRAPDPGPPAPPDGPDVDPPPPLPPGPQVPLEEIPIAPYVMADPNVEGTPEEFYAVSRRRVEVVLVFVVGAEGPIHMTELCRRVAAAWGLRRAGSQIQARVARVAEAAVRARQVRKDGDFFLPVEGMIKPRCRSDLTAGPAEHIYGGEVEAAIRLLLAHRAPLLADEIVTETARLLGFGRTGRHVRGLIVSARDRLVAQGELVPGGTGISLLASNS